MPEGSSPFAHSVHGMPRTPSVGNPPRSGTATARVGKIDLVLAEVTTAALMSENKHLANPCSTDSTPTSANQEDHVSMATFAARRLHDMLDNVADIVAIELLAAAQGIEFICVNPLDKEAYQAGMASSQPPPSERGGREGGFDDIIARDPAVRGTNPPAMCGPRSASTPDAAIS